MPLGLLIVLWVIAAAVVVSRYLRARRRYRYTDRYQRGLQTLASQCARRRQTALGAGRQARGRGGTASGAVQGEVLDLDHHRQEIANVEARQ
jgi:hypothetical protein